MIDDTHGKLGNLEQLKSLNVDDNKLSPGTLTSITKLTKLKTLSANNNQLGRPYQQQSLKPAGTVLRPVAAATTKATTPTTGSAQALPDNLPKGLKTLLLSRNYFSSIPPTILLEHCGNLETLDLSYNNLGSVPNEIQNLKSLRELNLDNNMIVHLPDSIGKLSKLRVLSLRNNKITKKTNSVQQQQQQQPLPRSLFVDTPVIDLNLHGNPLSATELNSFDGFSDFLARRKSVKDKTMSNLDVCGLK
jgi:Leucine-rich repeat (LRR) protein